MCDVNSPRRPGPNGEGDKDALDGQGPLHIASQWGQEHIVQCLVEHQADINARVSKTSHTGGNKVLLQPAVLFN